MTRVPLGPQDIIGVWNLTALVMIGMLGRVSSQYGTGKGYVVLTAWA